jgi:hypothetical protein
MKIFDQPSIKKFQETGYTSSHLTMMCSATESWAEIKQILKHKDCPKALIEHYTKSDIWYERLVAFCTKKYRKEMFEQAIRDPKSTVRAAAYKGAIRKESADDSDFWRYGWLPFDDVMTLVKADPRVHNYFKRWI